MIFRLCIMFCFDRGRCFCRICRATMSEQIAEERKNPAMKNIKELHSRQRRMFQKSGPPTLDSGMFAGAFCNGSLKEPCGVNIYLDRGRRECTGL